ncbi:MAG: CDP-archaeol synthase [Alphaproteobacteria bacterium]|nr:CDP-archaeol synthase [Alphaproteobacteria bacterium]
MANGSPIFAAKLLGLHWSYPADCNVCFFDRERVFGPSKTLRGIGAAVLATAGGAVLFGIDWRTGVLVGASAMAGDLISSFTKRRLGLAPSSRAWALDQVPEALLPVIVCEQAFAFTPTEIAMVVVLFFVAAVLLSRLLFSMGLRKQPY